MSKLQKFLTVQIVAVSLLLFSVPSAFGQISNIQVSNLTSSSATISWTTADTTDGCIHYGLTTSLGDTACDPRPDDDIHFVQITGLSTDTIYYFEVASGGEVDSNGGDYYTFKTTKVGIGVPYTIYGLVYLSDSTTAAEGTIVSAVVKSQGGNSSYPLADLTNSTGVWFLNLGDLKDPTTNAVFSYSVGDSILITAEGARDGEFQHTDIISGDSPQQCDTLILAFRGDVTGDGIIDLGDLLFLISYLYKGGLAPDPLWIGDVNCDFVLDLGDVLYLISYLYKGGPAPIC